ncbi:MmyB family transcriptional regulator [Paenibacillus harenae]|uniref:MmyB family transcriptional regulator n=1 Tax=Paenibacillus harenae TaxID=306543 RepID=UPI00279270CA|nr:hypothetical protein [Paenibacillus harenae]MDQ0062473.1 PAS domain-containing protein [Paenibacillus harenae]
MDFHLDLRSEAKVLKTLLGEIETIRTSRWHKYREQSHPMLKRFTQQELNDEACATYKNLLTNRSRRLPSRETVLAISNYLECTSSESNDLLLAAGYVPEHRELEGRSLKLALEQSHLIMNALPLPAIIATHKFEIVEANKAFGLLYGIPVKELPPQRRSMIHLHFNSEYPIRSRSTFDAAAFQQWESHAVYGIQTFKQNNKYCRYDAWYRNLIRQFNELNDFKTYWSREVTDSESDISQSKVVMARMGEGTEWMPIRLRQIHISVSSRMYPRIEAFLPEDEPARNLFTWLGCPVEGILHDKLKNYV